MCCEGLDIHRANHVWVAYITYILLKQGLMCLFAVMDLV